MMDEEKQHGIAKHRDTIRPENVQQQKLQPQSLTAVMHSSAALVSHSNIGH